MDVTNADRQLAQELVEDWIGEEMARAGDPFALETAQIAAYGVDETAIEDVCQRLASKPNVPLEKQGDSWVVVP